DQQDPPVPAALKGKFALAIVREKVLQSGKEKGPESSPRGHCLGQVATIEDHGEEPLGEILRLRNGEASSADVRVERIPVDRAERFERAACCGRIFGSGDHKIPPGRREIPGEWCR